MKRTLDISISAIALVLLSPLLLAIAILVRATSRGGVFFRGVRVGQHGRTFRIFKFRTMIVDAEGSGNWNVGLGDSRVTRVGGFLRASKLDEIPQFFNVLLGDMNLVGPRPELKHYVELYTPEQHRILEMKPGITDWASLVNYSQYREFMLAEDPDELYLRKIRPIKLHLQLYQLEHQSLRNEIRVLAWTLFNALSRSKRIPADIQRVVATFASAPISEGQG